ncbi:MAG: hypothetical protein ACXWP6_10385 [Ktedonobacterales bacterium]
MATRLLRTLGMLIASLVVLAALGFEIVEVIRGAETLKAVPGSTQLATVG